MDFLVEVWGDALPFAVLPLHQQSIDRLNLEGFAHHPAFK
jgi:hypothetical protein